ncbi:MAG: S-layer homology domain-containing protein [Firmicutes bacterium]|nr:S-layer homology domain-containing protein [Bacillota bacterium]
MKKTKAAALLLVLAMLLATLSGCILAETGFEFAPDGSVNVTDGFYYSAQYFEDIKQSPQQFFASLDEPVYDIATVVVDDVTYYGFDRLTSFASVDELKAYHDSSEEELPWDIEILTEDDRQVIRMVYTVESDEEALKQLNAEGEDIPDVEGLLLARLNLSFPGGVKSVTGAPAGTFKIEGRGVALTVSSKHAPWNVTVEGYLDGYEDFKEPVSALPFKDIHPLDYYYDAVVWAYTHEPQVTDGMRPAEFMPGLACTRGQVVTFLWRTAGCPEPQSTENPFTDVAESDWFYKPVLWAVEQGITDGMRPTEFMPKLTCTNAHILTFIWRAVGRPGDTGAEKTSQWYADSYKWADENGLFEGTYSGSFEIGGECPRANVVEYLYRYETALKQAD